MEDLTGRQLGQYQIIALLSEGEMATVYRAYQASVGRYVALKILPRHYAGDPNFAGRFEQEARVIASLEHPHILPVYDYGEAGGYTYIAMRYVQGGPLANLLQGHPMPLSRICHVISQMAQALDYAHARHIVHRDVKPTNVLIDDQGNCLLTDFGIAKVIEATARFTATGAFVGTPIYASPEQCLGHSLDGRSDIYSLGVVLYEMATGRPPFDAETPMGIIVKHISEPLPPPRTINPALPAAVEQVMLKALAKDPQDRYQEAGEMAQALTAGCVEETARPKPAPQPAVPSRPRSETGRRILARGWMLGSVAAMVVLIVLAGLIGGSIALWKLAGHPMTTPTIASAVRPTLAAAPLTLTPVAPVSAEATLIPPEEPSPPPSGSPDTGPHPAMSVSPGGEIHLAWADRTSGVWNIYYARSTDGGATFSRPIPVDAQVTGAARGHPALALSPNGRVHIAWEDKRNGNWDVFHTCSDDGTIFSSPIRLNGDATQTDQMRPALAVDSNSNVYLAWQDNSAGNWDIYSARSTDGGVSFSASVQVNTEARGEQVDPTIGVDRNARAYVAWADKQSESWAVYYALSEAEGFARGQAVGSGLMADLADELPELVVGPDGKVHIAWANAYIRHPTYGALLYLPVHAVSADGGETFSDPRQVGEGYRYVSVRQNEVGLAADGATVHVVFTTYSPRDGSWVWYYRSDDSGQTFSAGIGVKQVQGGDVLHYPTIAVDQKGHIYVVWAHQRADEWDIYYAQSTNGGVTFSTGQKIPGER